MRAAWVRCANRGGSLVAKKQTGRLCGAAGSTVVPQMARVGARDQRRRRVATSPPMARIAAAPGAGMMLEEKNVLVTPI